MLDQENQVGVEQSTPTPTTTATTTTTTTTTTSNNKPQQQQQNDIPTNNCYNNNNNNNINNSTNNPTINNNPSLFEHDYCSPNKGLTQSIGILERDCGVGQDRGTYTAPASIASSSSPPRSRNNGNTSVIVFGQSVGASPMLDKSGREKRKRKEVHDPEFSHFTSSEYSSSEAESEAESECVSEDDPNTPWCNCNKPHNGEFMIMCDICKYWFHGRCVGVTEAMGKKYEEAGKEWFCRDCHDQLLSGVEKSAIPHRLVKKAKKKSASKSGKASGKRGRGRPRKSEPVCEVISRISTRNSRKSTSAIETKLGAKKKVDARKASFEEFENNEKLKMLIKERKKNFFYKRSLAEQQKRAKMQELGLSRHTVTTPTLGHSLDSLATSTSTPNMSNLPINIKSELKERSKPNIVLQINTKKDGSSDQDSQRLVTKIVKTKKKKHSELNDPVVNDIFTAEPIQINKKSKLKTSVPSATTVNNAGDTTTSPISERKSTSPSIKIEKQASSSEHHQTELSTTPKRKRKDSDSMSGNGSSAPIGSKQIATKIKECLEGRCKQLKDIEVKPDRIEKLASSIENQLNECFKEGSPKYLIKYRSLVFNLRDQKNQTLIKSVLSGDISPSRLVRMSPEDLARSELAKWRERENKHSIELIKRDAQLAAQQVIVKKTHKGEEVISAPAANEPDDPTAVVNNQEPPTTPTKPTTTIAKESPRSSTTITQQQTSPSTSDATYSSTSTTTLKMRISSSSANVSPDTSSSDKNDKNQESGPNEVQDVSTASIAESLPFMDTTKDHKNHTFDMNCRICTKQQTESTKTDTTITPTNKANNLEQQRRVSNELDQQQMPTTDDSFSSQPKRLRVSIDTKMDPAHLSRLKEPLIKPTTETTTTTAELGGVERSPSKMSPTADPMDVDKDDDDEAADGEVDEEDDEDLYDPELVVLNSSNNDTKTNDSNLNDSTATTLTAATSTISPNEPCWSGLMTVPDVGKFSTSAKPVSGNVNFMKDELGQNLIVCGRIAPDQVTSYIKKLKTTTKNHVLLVQLHPQADEDKANFDAFFDYLYSRNRCAVISTGSSSSILKDFYILPIHQKSHIPDVLKPINGPGLDRRRNPNCLLGLLVKSKRPASASSSASSYTPTPINK